MSLDPRSAKNLEGVHEDLVALFATVQKQFNGWMLTRPNHVRPQSYEIVCIEGLRDIERQEHLIKTGASRTMNSRHLTGHAVDFAIWINGTLTWEWKYYESASQLFSRCSQELHIPITWGGDWPSHDGPHIQLTWAAYPLSKKPKTEANSKTIAAGAGTGAVVILQEIVPQITGLDIPWAKYIVLAVVLALVGLIIYERAKKIDDEGV